MKGYLKLALDLMPLAGFFIGYKLFGLMEGTIALMVMTALALVIAYIMDKRIALSPLITGVLVGVLGVLTLALHDEWFIKVKPTLVNLTFAFILFAGLAMGKGLLKHLLEVAFQLPDRGWFILSRRWAFFFTFLALVNEYVWRHYPTETWVNFKVFGMFTMTIIFTLAQIGLLQRFSIEDDKDQQLSQ